LKEIFFFENNRAVCTSLADFIISLREKSLKIDYIKVITITSQQLNEVYLRISGGVSSMLDMSMSMSAFQQQNNISERECDFQINVGFDLRITRLLPHEEVRFVFYIKEIVSIS